MKRVLMVVIMVGLLCGLAWADEKSELNLTIENCQLKMELLNIQFNQTRDLFQKSQERLKAIVAQEEQKAKEKAAKEKIPAPEKK
jgi:hypothetical protein